MQADPQTPVDVLGSLNISGPGGVAFVLSAAGANLNIHVTRGRDLFRLWRHSGQIAAGPRSVGSVGGLLERGGLTMRLVVAGQDVGQITARPQTTRVAAAFGFGPIRVGWSTLIGVLRRW